VFLTKKYIKYTSIFKKYCPPDVKIYYIKNINYATAGFQSLSERFEIHTPKITSLLTLAVALHEVAHVKYKDGRPENYDNCRRLNPDATSIYREILRMSPQIDQERRAWKFVHKVFKKEGLKISKALKKFEKECLGDYVAYILADAINNVSSNENKEERLVAGVTSVLDDAF